MSDESTAGDTPPSGGAQSHDSQRSDPADGSSVNSGVNAVTSLIRSDGSALEPVSNGRRQSEEQQKLTNTPEERRDTQCGLGGWRPSWLQRLASKKAYVLLHGLIGFHQLAMVAYMVGTFSTIEKRFKIPSKTTGLIAAVLEIGALSSLLIMGYWGRQGHKPRMVGMCTILLSIALLGRLLPHWVYGPGQDALQLTKEYGDAALLLSNSSGFPLLLVSGNETN